MWAAGRILSTPVNMGRLQLSLASVMTGLCLVMTVLAYSSLQRSELRAAVSANPDHDQLMRDVFEQGRNLYLSLLGTSLWATAWRLKALYDTKRLTPPPLPYGMASPRGGSGGSGLTRWLFVLLGGLCILAADIPLCRINYNLQLSMYVTPSKMRLMAKSATQCEGITSSVAQGECLEFCTAVRGLAEERNAALRWARDWHILGRVAAEIFDSNRGVQQGVERIDDLFAKRSCLEVLRSVDKSNVLVNWTCKAVAAVSILGAFTAFANVLVEDDQDPQQGNAKID